MTPGVPLLIVQGDKDQLVDYRGTYAYYQQVCKNQNLLPFTQSRMEIIVTL